MPRALVRGLGKYYREINLGINAHVNEVFESRDLFQLPEASPKRLFRIIGFQNIRHVALIYPYIGDWSPEDCIDSLSRLDSLTLVVIFITTRGYFRGSIKVGGDY